jgi:hypothetical protein
VDNNQLTVIESVLETSAREQGIYESGDFRFDISCAEFRACSKPAEGVPNFPQLSVHRSIERTEKTRSESNSISKVLLTSPWPDGPFGQ